jgi:hypothetical protein
VNKAVPPHIAITLAIRSFCYDNASVNGKEFIRRARKWAKAHETEILVDVSRGKGGHQIVRIGAKWTTVQTGELKPGIFHAMLKQLGIPKHEF